MSDMEKVAIPTKEESEVGTMGGRRKLRLAKKKTVRRILRKMGLKMRGGASALSPAASGGADEAATPEGAGKDVMGGRRRSRRGTRRGRKSRRSLFGLVKY
jgi:hypothetical protein